MKGLRKRQDWKRKDRFVLLQEINDERANVWYRDGMDTCLG